MANLYEAATCAFLENKYYYSSVSGTPSIFLAGADPGIFDKGGPNFTQYVETVLQFG